MCLQQGITTLISQAQSYTLYIISLHVHVHTSYYITLLLANPAGLPLDSEPANLGDRGEG